MKLKTIAVVVLVAVISSVGSSLVTLKLATKSGEVKNTSSITQAVNTSVSSTKSQEQNVYQQVAKNVSPAVVGIIAETTVSSEDIFSIQSGESEAQYSGTGFVVDSSGYILTNSHVVVDGKVNNVKVLFNDNTTSTGKVIWNDANLDLAIVKVNKSNLTVARLGDSDSVTVGDIAVAIGNPLGTDYMYSVTQGIISGLNRDITTSSYSMSGLIQTDASINSGNSGGPLLNSSGEVIGINTARANGDNIGFSIPINIAKTILQKVIKDNNYTKPLLGINGIDVKQVESYTGRDLGVDSGVYITKVESGSLADKAGIKSGDIITKMDSSEIKYMGDISKKMYSVEDGEKGKITVYRNGKTKDISLTYTNSGVSKIRQ